MQKRNSLLKSKNKLHLLVYCPFAWSVSISSSFSETEELFHKCNWNKWRLFEGKLHFQFRHQHNIMCWFYSCLGRLSKLLVPLNILQWRKYSTELNFEWYPRLLLEVKFLRCPLDCDGGKGFCPGICPDCSIRVSLSTSCKEEAFLMASRIFRISCGVRSGKYLHKY